MIVGPVLWIGVIVTKPVIFNYCNGAADSLPKLKLVITFDVSDCYSALNLSIEVCPDRLFLVGVCLGVFLAEFYFELTAEELLLKVLYVNALANYGLEFLL